MVKTLKKHVFDVNLDFVKIQLVIFKWCSFSKSDRIPVYI